MRYERLHSRRRVHFRPVRTGTRGGWQVMRHLRQLFRSVFDRSQRGCLFVLGVRSRKKVRKCSGSWAELAEREISGATRRRRQNGKRRRRSECRAEAKGKCRMRLVRPVQVRRSYAETWNSQADSCTCFASQSDLSAARPVFGVPLEEAFRNDRSHDGIPLPRIVRRCVDFVQENGANSRDSSPF